MLLSLPQNGPADKIARSPLLLFEVSSLTDDHSPFPTDSDQETSLNAKSPNLSIFNMSPTRIVAILETWTVLNVTSSSLSSVPSGPVSKRRKKYVESKWTAFQ